MKLTLTNDDGVVLDELSVTAEQLLLVHRTGQAVILLKQETVAERTARYDAIRGLGGSL